MDKYDYEKRIAYLIPINHLVHLENSNPLRFLKEKMKVHTDDIKSIYWYSFYFINTFNEIKIHEGKEYHYSSSLYQDKYIKLARLEYYFCILSHIDRKLPQVMIFGKTCDYIENVSSLIVNKILKLTFPEEIFLFQYEVERVFHIRQRALHIRQRIDEYKQKLLTVYLLIFHKKNENKITCSFLMKEIYSFLESL